MNGKTADSGRFLSNVNFRRALSYALDRSAACATVLPGQTPASRLIDPDANGISGKYVDEYPIADGAGINITADVAKAQEFLQLALTELGATIEDVPELSMLCYESQGSQTQLQAYQDMFLTVLGIKCVIDPQPIQQMIGKVYSFDYDFWLGGVSIGSMDVASADGALNYWDMSNPDALFGYQNQTFSDLLAEAQQATDLQVRYDKIAELEKIFIDEVPDLLITWKTINVMFKQGIVITSIDKSYGADLAFADIIS
jgi:oligopeptide transport system substrate-binding protein